MPATLCPQAAKECEAALAKLKTAVNAAVKSRSTLPGSKAADDAQKEAEALKDGLPRLPLIVMTARTSPDDLRQYMEAGMDGCVSKPLATAALLSTVRAAVPKHGRPLAKADNVETSLQKKKGASCEHMLASLEWQRANPTIVRGPRKAVGDAA